MRGREKERERERGRGREREKETINKILRKKNRERGGRQILETCSKGKKVDKLQSRRHLKRRERTHDACCAPSPTPGLTWSLGLEFTLQPRLGASGLGSGLSPGLGRACGWSGLSWTTPLDVHPHSCQPLASSGSESGEERERLYTHIYSATLCCCGG